MHEKDFIKLGMVKFEEPKFYYYTLEIFGDLHLTSSCSDEGDWKLYIDTNYTKEKELTVKQAKNIIKAFKNINNEK